MPRATADAPITTPAARDRLSARAEPYWKGIEAGIALGYRKGKHRGTWLARLLEGRRYREEALGRADDTQRADADVPSAMGGVLDFRQAQAAALAWAGRRRRIAAGLEAEPSAEPAAPYAVANAIEDYLAEYAARGGSRSAGPVRWRMHTFFLPSAARPSPA